MTQYKIFILVLCLISVIFGQNDFRLTKTEDINSINKIDSSLFHQNGDDLFIILTDDNSVTKLTINGQEVTETTTIPVGSSYEFSLLVKTDTSYGYLFSGRSDNDSRPSGFDMGVVHIEDFTIEEVHDVNLKTTYARFISAQFYDDFIYMVSFDSAAYQLTKIPVGVLDPEELSNSTLSWDLELEGSPTGLFIEETTNRLLVATSTSLYSYDLNNMTSEENDLSFRNSSVGINFKSSFYDPARQIVYFIGEIEIDNENGTEVFDTITRVNSFTFASNGTYQFQIAGVKDIDVATIDYVTGQAYFVAANSLAVRFSLPKFRIEPQETVSLSDNNNAGTYSVEKIYVNTTSRLAYIISFDPSNKTVLQMLSIPNPCPNNCNNRGDCYYETCNCTAPVTSVLSPGYGGSDCSDILCLDNCNGNGLCNFDTGTCFCNDGYYGTNCSYRTCKGKNNCGYGTCNLQTFECQCDLGFGGEYCDEIVVLPCEYLTDCDQCLSNSSCGWCATSKTCHHGDLEGPIDSQAGCQSWHYDSCPEPVMYFFSILFGVILAILLLVNIVSIYRSDRGAQAGRPDESELRRDLWRFQRSAKAWFLMDQLQFAAITGMFAVKVPSLYQNFVTAFRWTILGFPLPWSMRDQEPILGREILSMKQHSTSTLAFPEEILYGNLFWLFILFLIVLFYFLVIKLHAIRTEDDNLHYHAKLRIVYSLFRLILFAYFPLAVTASFSIGYTNVSGAIIGAIVLAFLLGFAAFVYWLLPRDPRTLPKLFAPEFHKRFGCLYQSFYFRRNWYMLPILARKFTMGIVVGFSQKSQIATLILLALINLVYLVQLLIVKPYIDHIHLFVDALTTILNVVIVLLMFAFLDGVSDNSTSVIITAFLTMFLLITMILAVGAFLNSWFKMKNIHSLRQLVARIRGKDRENDPSNSAALHTDLELSQKID